MSKILGGEKPKAFKPSAEQKELEKRQKEDRLESESEIAEKKALRKRKGAGRVSLLTGSETGLPSTLG